MRPARLMTLFYLSLLGMELSYLYLVATLFGGPAYIPFLMLLLYPLALLFRLAVTQSLFPRQPMLALEVTLVVLVILAVTGERLVSSLAGGQADIFGIILRMGFSGVTWWMGHTVPREEVKYTSISFRLQMGILVLLILAPVAANAPLVFLFFLLAPSALYLARWASSFSRQAVPLRPPNLGHLLLAGATVMVPGTALILLLSPEVARAIVGWLGNIFMKLSDWLDAQHKAAATPPGEFKFSFGCDIRSEGGIPSPTPPPPPSEGTSEISPVVIWLIVFALFLAMVTLIALALRRLKARRQARQVEPVQFQLRVVSLNLLRSLKAFFPQLFRRLWLWLRSLLLRWKRRPKPAEEPLVSIRALYRRLLRWAERQGAARAPEQTPLEHLGLLEQRFPQQQDDLKQITQAYLLARYSRKPASNEEFEAVKKAWQRFTAYHAPSKARV